MDTVEDVTGIARLTALLEAGHSLKDASLLVASQQASQWERHAAETAEKTRTAAAVLTHYAAEQGLNMTFFSGEHSAPPAVPKWAVRMLVPATSVIAHQSHGQHGREVGSSRRSTAKRSSSSSSGEDGEPPPPRGGLLAGLTARQLADVRNWCARIRLAMEEAREAELALLALLALENAALECRKCGESKPRDNFPTRENGRLRSSCKACESKRVCSRYHERKRVVA